MSKAPEHLSQQELESYLWGAANLLRGLIDAGDYKQYVFPLLFFKRLSDVWDEEYRTALSETTDAAYARATADDRFAIPEGAHWADVRSASRDVGRALLNAFRAIEAANPERLNGVFGNASWTDKAQMPDETLKNLIEHFSQHTLSLAKVPEDAPGAPRGDERGGAADQLDLSQVTWLHTNVRGWAKTSTITNTSIGDPPICIDHTKRGDWPRVSAGGTTVEGNPWVFAKVDGRWYAATYEWLRPGQECKGIAASNIGAHIKVSPLSRWTPQSGETIGLMVSTPARFGPQGPRHERSNVVRVRWP